MASGQQQLEIIGQQTWVVLVQWLDAIDTNVFRQQIRQKNKTTRYH